MTTTTAQTSEARSSHRLYFAVLFSLLSVVMLTSVAVGDLLVAPKGGAGAADEFAEGTFSLTEQGFKGYPSGVPRPEGPFRLLEGAEYDAARTAANKANQAIRKADPAGLAGKEIHEIQPVKFGGSATDPANKIPLPRTLHRSEVTPWWNRLMKSIQNFGGGS